MENRYFPEIKNNFGFGLMRLQMDGEAVDYKNCNEMIDLFIQSGFNYFDTAHGYIDGKSELAVRDCLAARYKRDEFVLADKLSGWHFEKEEDIRPLVEAELEACGVGYFDFFLMHAQDKKNHEKYKACRAYEIAAELKAEGKIRHIGISFHDSAEVLEQILTDKPEIEFVQIQFNYLDYYDPSVDSKRVYEVCRKFGKPVMIMEPVKGGKLSNLPEKAAEFLKPFGGSNASFAIRYAAGFEGVAMVLSGMTTADQMRDNLSYMKDFAPLSDAENEAIKNVVGVLKEAEEIPCTACRYCTEGCPMGINIPEMFACFNKSNKYNNWDSLSYISVVDAGSAKASDCIGCGACAAVCPQHLEIPDLLKKVAETFEK